MLKLIQGYYHFLALGKFMEQVLLTNDLRELAMDYPLKTWPQSSFMLKESLLKQLMGSLYAHPDKRNVYGYLTEISAFKGIFSIVREMIENNAAFREFLKTQLQDQYFPFEQTIRFLRNVLNHATSGHLEIKQEDYDIQRDFILSPKVQRVNQLKGSAVIKLDFCYHKYIKQWQGSKDYGVSLELDFAKLKPGMLLEKLVSWHTMYLLAELCFNLSQIALATMKPSSPSSLKKNIKKTTQKSKNQTSPLVSPAQPAKSTKSSSRKSPKKIVKKQKKAE